MLYTTITSDILEDTIDLEDVVKLLDMSRQRLLAMSHAGKFPPILNPGRNKYRVYKADLDRWLLSRTIKPIEEGGLSQEFLDNGTH